MSFVIFSLAVSTVFAAVCFGMSGFGRHPGRAALVALIAMLPAALYISVPWFLQALATMVLGLLVWLCGFQSKKAIAPVLLLPLAASYWYILSATAEVVAHLEGLRERYPLVSLESRLEFERNRSPSGTDSMPAETKLTADVEVRLAKREGLTTYSWRHQGLKALHGDVTNEFVRATGFGVYRMPPITRMITDATEPAPVPLPGPSTEPYSPADPQPRAAEVVAPPTKGQAYATHISAEYDFFDRERMGYVESRERTVGFEPHGFAEAARVRDETNNDHRHDWPVNHNWTIVRLELVSLLKHDPPAAYVSKNLPKMDELKDAATRPLDAFERGALSKLRRDDDVVVEDSHGAMRMLGALRAGTDCLACHRGSRGDLLGAFSYELRPNRPAPRPTTKPAEPQARLRLEFERGIAGR